MNGNNITCFDSFGVENILTGNKDIKSIIYRIQANYLIMCGYFCIGFTDFMIKLKSLLERTNLFSLNEN